MSTTAQRATRVASQWEAQRSFDEMGRPLRDLTFCVVDLVVTGEVEVPVLGRTARAGDVEAREVAAAGASPTLAVAGNAKVGGLVSHEVSSGRGSARSA
jgi:hypothetical protein